MFIGEVIYTYKCPSLLVQATRLSNCYAALPVTLIDPPKHLPVNIQFFLEPISHRLTKQGIQVTCDKFFITKFQNLQGDWVAANPDLSLTSVANDGILHSSQSTRTDEFETTPEYHDEISNFQDATRLDANFLSWLQQSQNADILFPSGGFFSSLLSTIFPGTRYLDLMMDTIVVGYVTYRLVVNFLFWIMLLQSSRPWIACTWWLHLEYLLIKEFLLTTQ